MEERRAPWGVLIVTVIALIMGWVALSAWQRSEVEVSWAAPPTCQAGTARGSSGTGDVSEGITIDVRPDTRCRLTVRVTNHGWSRAGINRVSFAQLATSASGPLRVSRVGTMTPRDVDGDAVLTVGRTLGAGDHLDMSVDLVSNPGACWDAGVDSRAGVPTVSVSSFEQSGMRSNAARLIVRTPTDHHVAGCF